MKHFRKNWNLRPPLQTKSIHSSIVNHHNGKPPEEPSLLEATLPWGHSLGDTAQLGRCHRLYRAFQKSPVELLRHCVQSNNPTPPSKWQDIRAGLKRTRAQSTSIQPGSMPLSYPCAHRSQATAAAHQPSKATQERFEFEGRGIKDGGGAGQGRRLQFVSHCPLPRSRTIAWAVMSVGAHYTRDGIKAEITEIQPSVQSRV